MDQIDKKECIIFDDDAFALGLPRRRVLSFSKRALVWGICAALAVVLWICASNGVFDEFIELVCNSVNLNNRNEGAGIPPAETEGETEKNDSVSESECETDVENGEESEDTDDSDDSENVTSDSVSKIVSTDLSLAERGDGYIVNYSKHQPDTEGLLEMGFHGGRYSYTEQPVVLILHTHTEEGYYDFNENDPSHILTKSVVSVGERVAYELNRRGIPTVHCTVIHENGGDGAYASAAETIRDMLKIYPSIEYVIDLHRLEAVDANGKILRTESALGTAQIRLTVSSQGVLERETLALALSLRRKLNVGEKRLCMPVVFTDSKLNAEMAYYYLKVDVGSWGNEASEALATGEIFAATLAETLKKQ